MDKIEPSNFDPYHDKKPIHRAKLISPEGDVSPLCATIPRKINLKVETWTNRDVAVTCKNCLRIIELKKGKGHD